MTISRHIKKIKNIKRRGISQLVFIVFAAVAILITMIIAFK